MPLRFLKEGMDWSFGSVGAEQLQSTPSETVSHSLQTILSQGYAAAVSDQRMKIVNPDDFATDDAALQALVDWLEVNTIGGWVHFGPVTPDGSAWLIENTVSLSPTEAVPVSFRYHGGVSALTGSPERLTTSINDGSEMFHICGQYEGGFNSIQGPSLIADCVDLGGNDAGVVRVSLVGKARISLGMVEDFRGDAVVFDSSAFEWRLDNTFFTPKDRDDADVKTARCIVLKDTHQFTQGTSQPDDGTIDPSVSTETEHDTCIAFDTGTSRVLVAGHYEGAHGRAAIDCPQGQLFVTPATTFSTTHNGAHNIYHDGGYAAITPSKCGNASGDGVRIGPSEPGPFLISENTMFGGNTGDAIHVESLIEGGGNSSIVPYEDAIAGSVTYPDGPWTRLFYPDGWRFIRTVTDTVPAGGSTTPSIYGGDNSNSRKHEWHVTSTPSSNVELTERTGFDSNSNQHSLILEETTGNADVGVEATFYRR